jgi:deoxyribose-phosphate aldolase
MKHLEYALYDMDFDEEEVRANVELAKEYRVNCISVPYFYIKFCRSIIKDEDIIISTSIDYPMGLSDTKSRNSAVSQAIAAGAQKIEIVIQNNLLSNRKYDKIRQDIKSNLDICQNKQVDLIYYLEYRIFTHHSLIKACDILKEFGLNTVYPSTGHMLDSIDDNIIASILLNKKTQIDTIFTGNIWTKEHLTKLYNSNITAIRSSNINAICLCQKFASHNY